HDEFLALDICKGIRPEINEPEAPKCYIDLMKNCWNSNPDNRFNTIEISRLISLFYSYTFKGSRSVESEQFKKAEEYRKLHLSSFKEIKQSTIHPQAIYTSRLLNSFTKDLPKYGDNNTDCLDC